MTESGRSALINRSYDKRNITDFFDKDKETICFCGNLWKLKSRKYKVIIESYLDLDCLNLEKILIKKNRLSDYY